MLRAEDTVNQSLRIKIGTYWGCCYASPLWFSVFLLLQGQKIQLAIGGHETYRLPVWTVVDLSRAICMCVRLDASAFYTVRAEC